MKRQIPPFRLKKTVHSYTFGNAFAKFSILMTEHERFILERDFRDVVAILANHGLVRNRPE